MPAIKYTSAVEPVVDLPFKNWTERSSGAGDLIHWWSIHGGRWTEESGRIVACAPRYGASPLIKTAASSGPIPGIVNTIEGALFTSGELNGLYCDTPVDRDNFGLAIIVWLGTTVRAQNRDLLGVYGGGDALRIWRTPAGDWSWRNGSTDAAVINRPWAAGPLLILADRIGAMCSLRLRDRAGSTAVMSGAVSAASVSMSPRVVIGQDEISDGHPNAAPNASRAWSEYIMDSAVYAGPCVNDAGVVAFWDDYFTTVYGAA